MFLSSEEMILIPLLLPPWLISSEDGNLQDLVSSLGKLDHVNGQRNEGAPAIVRVECVRV